MSEKIDSGLLTSFLLLQTVIPAVYNMGKRALPTMQVLSEVRRHEWRGVEVDQETPGNKNTDVQDHQKGITGEEWRV